VSEARSGLRSANHESRTTGRVHRRSGRRRVEAASEVLAVAEKRLSTTEQLAAPTRAPLDDLQKIIHDHRQFDSARGILDDWNDLDGASERAEALCQALDGWKNWADGRDVSPTDLALVATTLRDHQRLPGVGQVAESLAQWAEARGVELQRNEQTMPSIEMGIEL
jgi:hypothetical protein